MRNIAEDNMSYTMAEIRQILSGIRWVVTTFNKRQTYDHVLQLQMHQTLNEVKQTIADIDRTMDGTLYSISDLKQTLLFINVNLFNSN